MPIPKNLAFRWRREDCADSPYTDTIAENGIPVASMTREAVMDFFSKEFGFNEDQVALLMGGAHSLGKARCENSGHNGGWADRRLFHFNNEIFRNLINQNFPIKNQPSKPNDETDKKFQFNVYRGGGRRIGMLLNTDVQLAFNIDMDPLTGTSCKINRSFNKAVKPLVTCDSGNTKRDLSSFYLAKMGNRQADVEFCPASPTRATVEKYANSPEEFMDDFQVVFLKMLETGFEDKLELIQ